MATVLNHSVVEEVAASRRTGIGLLRTLGIYSIIARRKGGQMDMLPIERALEIEIKAWNVLVCNNVTSDSDLPIIPADVAGNRDIVVREVSFRQTEVSGAISRNNGGVIILVNQRDAPNRRRFTVAHELGHFYLHLEENQAGEPTERVDFRRTLYDGQAHTLEEEEANRFAAALLMPAPLIRQALHIAEDAQDLAASFGVSEEAMSIRLKTIEKQPELLYAVER